MNHTLLYKDRGFLWKKYWKDGLSTRNMATLCGCSRNTIRRFMDTYGIRRRTLDEASIVRSGWKAYKQKEVLRRIYKTRSLRQTARCFDVDKRTIQLWLGKHGIERRSPAAVSRLRRKDYLRRAHGSWLSRVISALKERILWGYLKHIQRKRNDIKTWEGISTPNSHIDPVWGFIFKHFDKKEKK